MKYVAPAVRRLAAALGVSNSQSLRSWILALLLVDPPTGYWSDPNQKRLPRRRRPGAVVGILRQALQPYTLPVLGAMGVALEKYALRTARFYEGAAPWLRWLSLIVVTLLLILTASTPLDLGQQMTMLIAMWALAMLVRKLPGHGPGLILMALSLIASSRYVWWRVTQTLPVGSGVERFLGVGLLAAECYTWVVLLFGFIQNARPLGRQPVRLPEDRSLWPRVDVFIPSYNEPLSVVKPTVLAALSLDWPADKITVHILDDGRRAAFREFADLCGANYLIRSDNKHAKAGNLNAALKITDAEFVAIFDCDHIPVRSFLTATMGWFQKDLRCAMLQTPHHFFSPDPFERNLGTFRRVPNEGGLFYGLVQEGNDLWNAAFFCGSCAVLRRKPLMEVGGIAVETVTEDAHTALKLHRLGYTTAYLRQILAAGLATESLSGHIGQRIRWARGMAQIFRLDNPFLGKGLTFFQRLCYSNAMLNFFSGVPRLVFLTAPLAYLYFEFHIINAAAATLAVYVLPHLVQSALANSHLQGQFRHSYWNEAYEAVLSWYIALPTTVALINPRLGKFNVTAKGGLVKHDFFDWRISAPYVVLVVLNIGGALLAIPRMLFWNSYEVATVAVNLIWTVFNLILLGAVLGVAAETRQVRTAHRVPKVLAARLYCADRIVPCETTDFSMNGLGLKLDSARQFKVGDLVEVGIDYEDRECRLPAKLVFVGPVHLGLQFSELSLQQEQEYVRSTFARPDLWADWGSATEPDRPLASFAEVFSFGATGYVRLLENMYIGMLRWARRKSRLLRSKHASS
jgi:cellulose synthase (UDP-forming)